MTHARKREFTGRHMALITVSFFAVIIGVNVTMAVFASRTWTGLVVENSYVESQQFQVKHDRITQQVQAGWRYSIRYQNGAVIFHAQDGTGNPLALKTVSAFLRRPVGGHDDQTVALIRTGDDYVAPVALASGVWDVTVTTGDTRLGPIELERRVTVP